MLASQGVSGLDLSAFFGVQNNLVADESEYGIELP
jgi:hypothetical protein